MLNRKKFVPRGGRDSKAGGEDHSQILPRAPINMCNNTIDSM